MDNKTRSILKVVAVILVIAAVMMQIGWLYLPVLIAYKFWLVILAFGLLLISSK